VVAAKTLAQIDITQAEADRIVPKWRKDNPEITGFWKELEKGLSRSRGHDHHIELHSGRMISFYAVKHDGTGWSALYERGGRLRSRIWGGTLCENCCQSVARDILGNAILALDDAEFRTLFSVHDEIVTEVPEEEAEDAAKEIARIMRIAPSWMPEIPLEVEVTILDHYKK
jgi:DNA polymerase